MTKYFTAQILDGLDYLHSKGIIHRVCRLPRLLSLVHRRDAHQDLKAANILVGALGCCKIADFGSSKQTDDVDLDDAHTSMQGSIFWMAPEVIDSHKVGYSSKVDIWSAGCVVFEMWTGGRPWSGQEVVAVLLQVRIRFDQRSGRSSLNLSLSFTSQKSALHCQRTLNCLLRQTIFGSAVSA